MTICTPPRAHQKAHSYIIIIIPYSTQEHENTEIEIRNLRLCKISSSYLVWLLSSASSIKEEEEEEENYIVEFNTFTNHVISSLFDRMHVSLPCCFAFKALSLLTALLLFPRPPKLWLILTVICMYHSHHCCSLYMIHIFSF